MGRNVEDWHGHLFLEIKDTWYSDKSGDFCSIGSWPESMYDYRKNLSGHTELGTFYP